METFENFDEQEDVDYIFLYLLLPSPEFRRVTNSFRTAVVRVFSYQIRAKNVSKPWLIRCCMQPWLRKLLNPYSIIYN